jgi:hypothetical protein
MWFLVCIFTYLIAYGEDENKHNGLFSLVGRNKCIGARFLSAGDNG